ncbi:MAG: ATP-grasp domain-containing protein [Proteobacteria bacterium]|nr:ATP-grasp domain-containing protein [Pseudomonadota bacterium]
MPVHRLLIANRGEIVTRIARTARQMGIATVAVYSDADRGSVHVAACDDTVPLGGLAAADSYRRIDKLLAAARASGADAIHPGYGFLSENAAFAAAVTAAGLVFVGPPPAAIDAMGDKARARQRMAAAGIAVVPGYDGDDQDPAILQHEADRIGYPVMVKAAGGGGGRGMRLVQSAPGLPDALRSAAAEAAKSFGDGRLILERALVEPRHVEIQVFADAHGNVLHLGERDCSVQRRHQKLIEESPSPAVNAELRVRMGAAAVAVAREIGYVGAGTVEFLLDRAGHFYFMEMNTRLQVEHPVTECVTGLDLVEWQLRVARGEPLPLRQDEVQLRGHAIEVRLCAESPMDDFMPGSGTIVDWSPPTGVRCDHALRAGAEVPAWYDSMVAKLIAHAPTREQCIDQLAAAVDRTVLLGLQSNRAFLGRLLRHESFRAGFDVSTAFIERHFGAAETRQPQPDARLWALAAWISVAGAPEAECTAAAWRNWSTGRPLPQPWRLRWHAPAALAGASTEMRGRLYLTPGSARVEHAAGQIQLQAVPVTTGMQAKAIIDGEHIDYRYAWSGTTLWLHTLQGDFVFNCRRREPARSSETDGAAAMEVRAAINGRVVEVAATTGLTVAKGDRLVVLEAMKMEHEIRAARAGPIADVAIKAGDQVVPGQVLVRYEGESA